MNLTPLASPNWLVPVAAADMPAGKATTWYASLSRTNRADATAYDSLRWLLNVLLCDSQPLNSETTNYWDTLLVPASDPLAVRIADTVTGLFLLTGAFTAEQAQALVYRPLPKWDIALPVPAGVVAPPQEARSKWGLVSPGWYGYFFEETGPDAAQPPRQGMVRAITEMEALDRVREALPEIGAFRWIARADFRLPDSFCLVGELAR